MAATACSLVERSSHPLIRISILAVHVLGGAAGGALVGAALGAAGEVAIGSWPLLVVPVAAVALVCGVWDLLGAPMRGLQPPAGVPPEWRSWAPHLSMGVYGLVLGAGLFTPYTAAAMYGLAALTIALRDPLAGAIAFGTYGFARAAVSMIVAIAILPARVHHYAPGLQRAKQRWRPVLGAAAVVAGVLTATFARG